jgi:glycosyltransferase involved in cell wall biosynthesis
MLSDRHNALLCKPGDPKVLASRILTLLEDADLRRRITDKARATAYEVFSLRRCLDQHLAVYDNVVAGRPAGQGLMDSAIDA